MITFKQKGDFRKVNSFFERLLEFIKLGGLDKYGREGVEVLSRATPVDSGLAASSWFYEITREPGVTKIIWHNSDIEHGCNVIILLQYGHATKNGGFVEGIDFINPAMKPLFDEIANSAWKEVSKL